MRQKGKFDVHPHIVQGSYGTIFYYFWIIMNPSEKNISQRIKAIVKQKDPSADVILFGSHSRGQATSDSDWDILILLNRQHVGRITEKEFRDELFDIELEIGEPISAFVFSKHEWETKHSVSPLYQSIVRDGIPL